MREIEQITTGAAEELATWVQQPNQQSQGLAELRSRVEALGDALGTRAKREALSALSGSDRRISQSRARQAAECLVAACQKVGIPIVVKQLKARKRRMQAARAIADTPSPRRDSG